LLNTHPITSKIISRQRPTEMNQRCVTEETDNKLVLVVNAMTNQREEIAQKDMLSPVIPKLAAVRAGLPNGQRRDEILGLLASIESDGKPTCAAFAAKR
jgi:hypothetical protein